MFGHRLFGIVIVVLGLGSVGRADLPDPPESKPLGEEVAKWIAELDSEVFSVRQEATQKLVEAGGPVVESLLRIAQSGSLEASTRAVAVLEAIYISSDIEAVDHAELALDELIRSERRSIAARADRVFTRHYDIREPRAVAFIRRLGGIVKYDSRADGPSIGGPNIPRRNVLRRGDSTLEITVNGETKPLQPGTTLAAFLEQLDMQPKYVAVERNLDLVPRSRHATCILQPGDRLEIVTLVGGG